MHRDVRRMGSVSKSEEMRDEEATWTIISGANTAFVQPCVEVVVQCCSDGMYGRRADSINLPFSPFC